jgi:hypothetical protein
MRERKIIYRREREMKERERETNRERWETLEKKECGLREMIKPVLSVWILTVGRMLLFLPAWCQFLKTFFS